MVDENRRLALIEHIKSQGGIRPEPEHFPVVSVEDFFTGNDDPGSIGPNLIPHPGVATFAQTLMSVRERADVQDVLVAITDMEEETPGMWPFSDYVYILTRAPAESVRAWMAPLQADEASQTYAGEPTPTGLPAPRPVTRCLWCGGTELNRGYGYGRLDRTNRTRAALQHGGIFGRHARQPA